MTRLIFTYSVCAALGLLALCRCDTPKKGAHVGKMTSPPTSNHEQVGKSGGVDPDRHEVSPDISAADAEIVEKAIAAGPGELDSVLKKLRSTAKSTRDGDLAIARAIASTLKYLTDEDVVKLIDSNSSGAGRLSIYSYVMASLSNNDLKRLGAFVDILPPSSYRLAGFRILFRKKSSDPGGFENGIKELRSLSEPEDLNGAIAGLRSSKHEMVITGILSEEQADSIIQKSSDNEEVAKQLAN